jgi:ABC-type lipoprotein export system ATPase subunit
MELLSFRNVTKWFDGPDGRVIAVRDVNFSVNKGEFVAVRGPSGCGKTTLLLMAGTLLKPSEGSIFIEETNPYELEYESRCRFRAGKIGFVFQQFFLIPYLSVLENVMVPAGAYPRKDARERAMQLIQKLNLEPRTNHVPSQLSAGECQRTALARALFNEPQLLLADEPTGNLDRSNSEIVLNILKDFAKSGGTVLLVTHQEYAASYADRTLFMEAGVIHEKV